MPLFTKNQKGFTLIEIIVTVAVLLFGVVVIYGSFFDIFNASQNIGPRFVASYLGQEGIEMIRNFRDNNFIGGVGWSTGLTGAPCNAGCQGDYKTGNGSQLVAYNPTSYLGLNGEGFYTYDIGGTPTIFTRKITITQISADILDVEVIVYWNWKGVAQNFRVDEYIYNWY